jgi:hypothetical protein
MDVNLILAGWPGIGCIVVFPKQEATLWQSVECHIVCASDFDCRLGGLVALQPTDKAEIQFGGNTYDYSCA